MTASDKCLENKMQTQACSSVAHQRIAHEAPALRQSSSPLSAAHTPLQTTIRQSSI